MTLVIQIVYWAALLVWSGVLTYVIIFILFPEKVHHDEPHHNAGVTPQFARHRFQPLPGNAELTVNDIVTALQHLPKKTVEGEPAVAEEPHEEAPEESDEEVPSEEPAHH